MIKLTLTSGIFLGECATGFALSFLEFMKKHLFPLSFLKNHTSHIIHRLIVLVEIRGKEEIQKKRTEKVGNMDKINSLLT